MELSPKKLMRIIGEHFRRYAHALRFAIGLHGAQKFDPIGKYKHYQISSGARASLMHACVYTAGACPGIRKRGGGPKSESLFFCFSIFKGGGAAQKIAGKMIFSTKKVAKYR